MISTKPSQKRAIHMGRLEETSMKRKLKLRLSIPFFVILFLTTIGSIFIFFHPIWWTHIQIFHMSVKAFAELHPILAPFLFIGFFILYALLSLPGIFALSLLSGYLFNQPFSTLYAVIGATIGASLLFLAARTAFGHLIYRKAGLGSLNKREGGFHKNTANYLLFLRLIPLFPFWVVNIAAAFFKVPFWIFVWTTFIGMIPSVFVYTQAGRGLTILLQSSDPLKPEILFNSYIIFALVGLAVLSLLPILVKYFRTKER
jgi:uncharacterized membrane protein YdjX (TVP38/TMEM64 family)